ncbi:MAG: hypothetical protein LBP72_10200 [Dysgonamonadaceae bacterium]|jgi:hypothetical protein|nr:hypothetical protein [Dysgonamonadaceae bacterium]
MKKAIFLVTVTIVGCQIASSQKADHVKGGRFLKRIEYNVTGQGMTEVDNMYNLDGKSILDRILFGSINSPVEFVFSGSSEGNDEILAFRITKNSRMDSYRLEIMRMPDVKKVYNAINFLSTKVNKIVIPPELIQTISLEGRELINEHNKAVDSVKRSDDSYKPYRSESKTFRISNEFVEKLHGKMAALIDNFKAIGIPPIAFDGYEVTFRTVVENEVWSLKIHMPQKNALLMANLCRQIIMDADINKPDETKYIELLEEMDFKNHL